MSILTCFVEPCLLHLLLSYLVSLIPSFPPCFLVSIMSLFLSMCTHSFLSHVPIYLLSLLFPLYPSRFPCFLDSKLSYLLPCLNCSFIPFNVYSFFLTPSFNLPLILPASFLLMSLLTCFAPCLLYLLLSLLSFRPSQLSYFLPDLHHFIIPFNVCSLPPFQPPYLAAAPFSFPPFLFSFFLLPCSLFHFLFLSVFVSSFPLQCSI